MLSSSIMSHPTVIEQFDEENPTNNHESKKLPHIEGSRKDSQVSNQLVNRCKELKRLEERGLLVHQGLKAQCLREDDRD